MEQTIAIVRGASIGTLPGDLYIPPKAMKVFLETFEGPLDLLLYLIRKHHLDILDILVSEIADQYIQYIEMMQMMELDLIGEYLAMAAMLAEIKSRMLLSRQPIANEEEGKDPRAELIEKLREYERFKQAAQDLSTHPQLGRDVLIARIEPPDLTMNQPKPTVTLDQLLLALKRVLERSDLNAHHQVKLEFLSVRERMADILSNLKTKRKMAFVKLFSPTEGRLGVVVAFIAVLELLKQRSIKITQITYNGPIHLMACGAIEAIKEATGITE